MPVYNETIDEIVGVVLSRNLLAYANDRLTGRCDCMLIAC